MGPGPSPSTEPGIDGISTVVSCSSSQDFARRPRPLGYQRTNSLWQALLLHEFILRNVHRVWQLVNACPWGKHSYVSLLQKARFAGDFLQREAKAEGAGGHFWHDEVLTQTP